MLHPSTKSIKKSIQNCRKWIILAKLKNAYGLFYPAKTVITSFFFWTGIGNFNLQTCVSRTHAFQLLDNLLMNSKLCWNVLLVMVCRWRRREQNVRLWELCLSTSAPFHELLASPWADLVETLFVCGRMFP